MDKIALVDSLFFEGKYNINACIRMMGVSKSTYYNYKSKEDLIKQRIKEKKALDDTYKEKMRNIIHKLGHVPGKRTFKTHLWRDYNIVLSIKKIKKLMYKMNLYPTLPKKDAYKGQAKHKHPCACIKNFVNQDFKIGPRMIILTDITYLFYGYSRNNAYLCVFKDAYTNEILGYSISNKINTLLVKQAYKMMIINHKHEFNLKDSSVYIHSDQGVQYTSTDYQTLLTDDNFIQSMSFRGNSQDNAPVESFFSRLKQELIDIIARCKTFDTLKQLIDGYIDYYNNSRYQLSLAGLSPKEFYTYVTTNIYPLDNYFGVKANDLLTIEELVNTKLALQKEKSDKRKELSYKKRIERSKIDSPLQLLVKDQKLINKEIYKYEQHAKEVEHQLNYLYNLKTRIQKAIDYFISLNKEERDKFNNPLHWQEDPNMNYVLDMADLY